MNINGKAIVRFNVVGEDKKILWSISLSKVDKDGKKVWLSVPVTFSKKNECEEKIKKLFKETKFKTEDKYVYIDIIDGFVSGYVNKDKKSVITFVIQDFKKSEYKQEEVKVPF